MCKPNEKSARLPISSGIYNILIQAQFEFHITDQINQHWCPRHIQWKHSTFIEFPFSSVIGSDISCKILTNKIHNYCSFSPLSMSKYVYFYDILKIMSNLWRSISCKRQEHANQDWHRLCPQYGCHVTLGEKFV